MNVNKFFRSDAADDSKYEFIANGCPEEQEPVLKINPVENGLIGIELESFAFVDEGLFKNSIFFKCQIKFYATLRLSL